MQTVRTRLVTGFTIIELLVAMAILSILAALLFPVFRSGVVAAKTNQCIQNMRQVGGAVQNYLIDYDDRFPPVVYREEMPGDSTGNRTWVQNLQPYLGTLNTFMCPSDSSKESGKGMPRAMEGNPDPGFEFFESSVRTNYGYNYLYLAPLVSYRSDVWVCETKKTSDVKDASSTIAFVDSVWDRDQNGNPRGGGSFIVVPPCRYTGRKGNFVDTFDFDPRSKMYFGPTPEGWHDPRLKDWLAYGGAWPWHTNKFNTLYLDNHAKSLPAGNLTNGCDFLPYWKGLITSREEYQWDRE